MRNDSDRRLIDLTASQLAEIIDRAVATRLSSTSEEREILTLDQACEFLQQSRKGVLALVKKGMPGYKLGSDWRFRRSEILRWLSEHQKVA